MGSSNAATNGPVPHSVEAEAAVLGTMLQLGGYGQAACRAALAGLSAEDFYTPAQGQVFEAIARLLDADHPPDVAWWSTSCAETAWPRQSGMSPPWSCR